MCTQVVIINSKNYNMTNILIKELYTKNLILCDDMSLEVVEIPSWAIKEVEEITKIDLQENCLHECGYTVKNKQDVNKWNKYHYPKLYSYCFGM